MAGLLPQGMVCAGTRPGADGSGEPGGARLRLSRPDEAGDRRGSREGRRGGAERKEHVSSRRGTSVGDPRSGGACERDVPLTTAVRGKMHGSATLGWGGPRSPARRDRPDLPAAATPGLSPVLERNIRALQLRRQREEKEATAEERVAEAITRFTGSMRFVYLHLAFFGFWIVANLGWVPGVPAWDPSFVVLAMVASVEAIFLSTFVLISQNRMAAAADKRADLDLQISLLAEHEVTRLVTLVSGIADRMGVKTEADAELEEITQDVAPEAVLDELEATEPGAEQH